MYNLVPDFTVAKPARDVPESMWPARIHELKQAAESAPQLTPADKLELARWDAEVCPPLQNGDFVENQNSTTITIRNNHNEIFDWYTRRCEFIAARKKVNAVLNLNYLNIPVEITVAPTQVPWKCTKCGKKAIKQISKWNNHRHNPKGPAVVKICDCGYKISKWYNAGALYKCKIAE